MLVDPSVLPLFVISALLVMVIPGPDMVLIVTNSVSGGKRSGAISALGISSGAFVHFVAAALGISAIILSSELAYDVVRFLGAGYLMWVGVQYLTTKTIIESIQLVERRRSWQIYRQGVLTNLLNPKAILFNLSFVPQFVSVGHGPVWAQILVLGGILIAVGILVNLLIVLMASQVSTLLSSKQLSFAGYFEKAAGVLLIGFAAYLAVARRPIQ